MAVMHNFLEIRTSETSVDLNIRRLTTLKIEEGIRFQTYTKMSYHILDIKVPLGENVACLLVVNFVVPSNDCA